jgi:hypothetical protein
MTSITTKPDSAQPAAEKAVDLFGDWFDPIETEVRARARELIEELIGASSMRFWPARVTNEARRSAMKEERTLRATATGAGCDR